MAYVCCYKSVKIMNHLVKDVPKIWIKNELKEQRNKLQRAEKATQWDNIDAYRKFINMRKELVAVCEKYATE